MLQFGDSLLLSGLFRCSRRLCSSHFWSCCFHHVSSSRFMISPTIKRRTSSSNSFNAKAMLQTSPRESGVLPRPSSARNALKPSRDVQAPQSPCSILITSPGSARWLSKPNDASPPKVSIFGFRTHFCGFIYRADIAFFPSPFPTRYF